LKRRFIVLINLGTPNNTSLWSVQKYLFQFLMDPCVIDIPWWYRLLLVGGLIVPLRSFKTRREYKMIWGKQDSPLREYSYQIVDKLSEQYNSPYQKEKVKIFLAMRYGSPSLYSVFKKIFVKSNVPLFINFLPLYPQASLSTTETVNRQIKKYINKFKKKTTNIPKINYKILPPFYNQKSYLQTLVNSISPYLKIKYDYLLFSYHGIPVRHLYKTDPSSQHCFKVNNCCEVNNLTVHRFCYLHQVKKNIKQLAKLLNLDPTRYSLSFQSRLGRSLWIRPYTDKMIIKLAKQGIKKLLVVCPAFVCDNLETLFEISIKNKELFKKHGGEELNLIPCLNVRREWINFLKTYIDNKTL
jgi:ferrochelatase